MPASPTVALELFPQDTTSDGNKILDLDLASNIEITEGERQLGEGRLTLPLGDADTTPALSKSPRVVRVKHAGTTEFEFYVARATRTLSDEQKGIVTLSGPSTRIALHAAIVAPYG